MARFVAAIAIPATILGIGRMPASAGQVVPAEVAINRLDCRDDNDETETGAIVFTVTNPLDGGPSVEYVADIPGEDSSNMNLAGGESRGFRVSGLTAGSYTLTVTGGGGETVAPFTIELCTPPTSTTLVPCRTTLGQDSFSVEAGSTLRVAPPGVTGNDTLCPGQGVAVQDEPGHGSLTLSFDGGFTYTPDAEFLGTDSFSYVASTAAGGDFRGAFGEARPAQLVQVQEVLIDVTPPPATTTQPASTTTGPSRTTEPGTTPPTTLPGTPPTTALPAGELPQTGGGMLSIVTVLAAVGLAVGTALTLTIRRATENLSETSCRS